MKLLLDIIAPHECIGCNLEGDLLCSECRKNDLIVLESSCFLCSSPTVHFTTCNKCIQKTNVEKLLIHNEYEGRSKELLHRLKFSNTKDASRTIAEILVDRFGSELGDIDLVTYIPTATKRIRKRGYDQSEKIAKHLANSLRLPFKKALVRTDQSRSVGSSKQQRSGQQSYRVVNELRDKKVLLVDDVVTTGVTFKKAATYFDKSNSIVGIAFSKSLLK